MTPPRASAGVGTATVLRAVAIPVCLRVALMVLAVALVAAALPFLPLPLVLPAWLALGLAMALPGAANAAVARGHGLGVLTTANPLHRLRRGAVLRVLVHGVFGIAAGAVLLVRLSAGGGTVWLATGAAGAAALVALRFGRGLVARHYAPVHADAALRRLAVGVGVVAVILTALLAGWLLGPPDPAQSQTGASVLVNEGFALHRLWIGVEAWILGAAVALDLLPPVAEALMATLLLGVSGWAAAALALAAAMHPADRARALAGASDAPTAPPPSRPAMLAAAALAAAIAGSALSMEARLAGLPPEARPSAQLQIAAERIGETFHLPGTYAAIADGRAGLAAQDAAALQSVRAQIDTAFDRMEAGVDPFLDGYYTLWAEYGRMGVAVWGWVSGDAEAALQTHLSTRLNAALDSETHLRPVTELLATSGLADVRATQAAQEAALLAAPLDTVNPARLRLESVFPALAPLPELRSLGFTTQLETRLGASAAVGVLGAVVARRVLQRLAARGVLRLGARALLAAVPLVGGAAALGADQVAIKLEEYLNRAEFRAEIVAAIEEQRQTVLATLDAIASE